MAAHWDLVLLFAISVASSMLTVLAIHVGLKRWRQARQRITRDASRRY